LGLNDSAEAIGKTNSDFFSLEHFQIAPADELKVLQTGLIVALASLGLRITADNHNTSTQLG